MEQNNLQKKCQCEHRLTNRSQLGHHQRVHMEYCSECDMMFRNSENLLIHKETVHTDEDMPNNKCDQCSYKSTNNTLLESHEIGVHEPPKIMLQTMTLRQIGLLNRNSNKFE